MGNINANLIRSYLDIYEDTQEREIDRLQRLIGEWGTTMWCHTLFPKPHNYMRAVYEALGPHSLFTVT